MVRPGEVVRTGIRHADPSRHVGMTAAEREAAYRASEANDALRALLNGDGALGPDDLITMAAAEMQNLDMALRQTLTEVRDKARKANNINTVLDAIDRWQNRHHTGDRRVQDAFNPDGTPRSGAEHAFLDLQELVTVTDPDGTTREVPAIDLLREAGVDVSRLESTVPGRPYVFNTASMGQLREVLRRQIERLNEGAEVRSLKLQQLVSRRGQFAQLVSQVMQSMHETSKSILQNTRA